MESSDIDAISESEQPSGFFDRIVSTLKRRVADSRQRLASVSKRRPSTNSVELGRGPSKKERVSSEPLNFGFLNPFPDDVWIYCILPRLPLKDLLNMRLVSRAANLAATDADLWQRKLEELSFYRSDLADRRASSLENYKRLHALGEAGRYAVCAEFPETMLRGMGIERVEGAWRKTGPGVMMVTDTTIGILTAERFINQMPRTPAQWIAAYTSVFNICGNRHPRGSAQAVVLDWELFQSVAYNRVTILMASVMNSLKQQLTEFSARSPHPDALSAETSRLWTAEIAPRLRIIQHIFARLSRYTALFTTSCVSLDKLPELMVDRCFTSDDSVPESLVRIVQAVASS